MRRKRASARARAIAALSPAMPPPTMIQSNVSSMRVSYAASRRAIPFPSSSLRKQGSNGSIELIVQVMPVWMLRVDQVRFPGPLPPLELLLTWDRLMHAVEHLIVDEAMHAIRKGS